jgi:hypothetical protein
LHDHVEPDVLNPFLIGGAVTTWLALAGTEYRALLIKIKEEAS